MISVKVWNDAHKIHKLQLALQGLDFVKGSGLIQLVKSV